MLYQRSTITVPTKILKCNFPNTIQSEQQKINPRVLSHHLFYRNVCLSLIVDICILAIHRRFTGCLPLIVAYNYRKRS
jgi:hypothetical protein